MRTILLFLAALLATVLPAQSEAALLKDFKVAFRPEFKSGSPAERASALKALAGLDSRKVAEVLTAGWKALEAGILAIDTERLEITTEILQILGDKVFTGSRQLPRPVFDHYQELRSRSEKLRQQVDAARGLLDLLAERIGALSSPQAHQYLLDKVVRAKRASLPLRLTAAAALGDGGTLTPELVAAMARARRADEKLSLAAACQRLGKAAGEAVGVLVEWLGSKVEAVREAAARALGGLARPAGILPLIEALDNETGMTRLRVAGALEQLTNQKHGLSVGAWRAWYEAEGKALTAAQLGGGMFRLPGSGKKGRYYFGLPQDGKHILYILDISDSMKKRFTYQGEEMERLQACKKELVAALGSLAKGKTFGLLCYNDMPVLWEKTMVAVTPQKVAAAQEWVTGLQRGSSTNIHDAMQVGFTMAGRGVHDRYYGVTLDTIFLLTDGSPTKPDGTMDSTQKILEAVRGWNLLKRVTIHTIGLGPGVNVPFLRQLARENGGEFRKY